MSREMGLDPGVFGRLDLAALVQPHLNFLFVCYPAFGPFVWGLCCSLSVGGHCG